MIFFGNSNESSKKFLANFCEYFEYGAVRRCANLVDLEKCFKMSIWLQKSASIQKRTSPLKFDHFRYPKADFTASNLSTKVDTLTPEDSSGPIVGRPLAALPAGPSEAEKLKRILEFTGTSDYTAAKSALAACDGDEQAAIEQIMG